MPYLSINSANRTDGSDSNFTINLPFSITKFSKIRLKSAQIYNSFYNVTDSSVTGTPPNNRLTFQISPNSNGSSATEYSITISQGYYTISTLLPALQTAINTAIAPLTCTVTQNALTKNVMITLSNNALYLNVLPLKENVGINLILGFSRSIATGFIQGSVTAPRLPNLNRYSVLYLETNLVRNTSLSTGSGINPNNNNQPLMFPITGLIQITSSFGDLVTFEDTTSVFLDIPNPISQIRCILRDSFGYSVSTNGLQVLLEFECF